MKKLLALLMLTCLIGALRAQDVEDEVPEKPKAGFVSNVVFQFDNRNENYYTTRARMNGLKIGLEFYKRLRTGFGFYSNNDYYLIPNPVLADSVQRRARFSYSTYFAEVVLFRSFRWELSAIGALGSGVIRTDLYSNTTSFPRYTGSRDHLDVKIRDIAFNAQFKVFPWLGVGSGVGYRNVFDSYDANLNGAFQDAYFDFKLKFFLGYAFKSIFKPEVIEAEYDYYEYRREKRIEAIKTFLGK